MTDTRLETLDDLRVASSSRTGAVPVDAASILNWCVAAEDPNPRHWPVPDNAELVAPSPMANVWSQQPGWTPSGEAPARPLELHQRMKEILGLPTAVVRSTSTWYGQPVRVGDRVTTTHRIGELGPEVVSARGVGHDWSVEVDHRNQHGELVALDTLSFHGYRPSPSPTQRTSPSPKPASTSTGRAVKPLEIDISTTRIIMAAAASRDWTSFHHDRDAAIGFGMRDIILNTPAHTALVTRWLLSEAVPDGRLLRFSLRLRRSVYPGDRLRISGVITQDVPHGARILHHVSFTQQVGDTVTAVGTAVVVTGNDPWQMPLADWAELDPPGAAPVLPVPSPR